MADVFECYLQSATSVVDPWNGTGTTTAVATNRNIASLGIDINPALTVIARARLTPKSIADSLVPIAEEIVDTARKTVPTKRENEPLLDWLAPAATVEIRKLQRAIHQVTSADDTLEVDLYKGEETASSRLPMITSFFYSVLFAATRDLLHPFRVSNPTWMVVPNTWRKRLRPRQETIRARFIKRTEFLCSRLLITKPNSNEVACVRTGHSLDVLPDWQFFDACLASPPYATRIDYVKSTMPELAILGLNEKAIRILRQRTTGTPVVRGVKVVDGPMFDEAQDLIEKVANHESHGSLSYYAPWLRNYLSEMHRTLELISTSVKPTGRIALVVQDSYYKTLHIDLQGLISASFATVGRNLISRHDFPVHNSMSYMNSRARLHLHTHKHCESLLVFA